MEWYVPMIVAVVVALVQILTMSSRNAPGDLPGASTGSRKDWNQ